MKSNLAPLFIFENYWKFYDLRLRLLHYGIGKTEN